MNTKERIIAHSFNLFLNKGYTSVNISHILKDLNLSRGAFYHHFRNKEEVLKEVIKKYYIDQLNCISEIVESADHFEDVIRGIEKLVVKQMNILLNVDDDRPNHYYLMFEAMKLLPEMKVSISRWYVQSIKKLKEFIEKCVESGEIRDDIEPSMLSLQMITQLEGLFILSHFTDKNMNKDEIAYVFDKIYNNVKYSN